MEYRFTYSDSVGEEISVCSGNNFLDALWEFYDLNGMVNIVKVERIY